MLPSAVFSTMLLTSVAWAQIPEQLTSGFDNTTISLIVTYGTNEVTDGEKLGLDVVRSSPTLALGGSSSLNTDNRYIVVMIDPDAPSRANPISANVLHWVKTDLRFRSSTTTIITADNATAPVSYASPSPPSGSGKHRYIFLLYDQPRGDSFLLRGLPERRTGFNVSAWREANGLAPAKAGRYFLAEFGNSTSTSTTKGGPSATGSSGDDDGGDSFWDDDSNGISNGRTGGSKTKSNSPNAAARVAASGHGAIAVCWVLAAGLGGFFIGM